MRRGEIWMTNLEPTKGAEMRKVRPTIIVQNDIGNTYSSTTIIVPITSQKTAKVYPTEVLLESFSDLDKISKAVCDQIRSVDKSRLRRRIGIISGGDLAKVDDALRAALALD